LWADTSVWFSAERMSARRRAQLREDSGRHSFFQFQQGEQDVLHVKLVVAVAAHKFLRILQHLARLVGETDHFALP
jgi:hypothetical protein